MRQTLTKIVSGGQTGVDRAALDAALEFGFSCGGWCPAGRVAEDGTLPAGYPVEALAGAGYRERTRKNVEDSDATVIIYCGELEGGTEQTLRFCEERDRPCLLIDATKLNREDAAVSIHEFVVRRGVKTLNVAGPRASKQPGIYDYTRSVLDRLLGA